MADLTAATRAVPATRQPTLWDAILINCAAAHSVDPIRAWQEELEDIEILRAVLPKVSRDSLMMRDLAVACDALVEAWSDRATREGFPGPRWLAAQFDVRRALSVVFRWRMGDAWNRVYAAEGQ
jgi:hypothetical protein